MTTVRIGVKIAPPCVHPYTHMISNQGTDFDHVMHYATTQISMKSVMEIFGTRGVNSVSKGIKQLHLRNTFEPLYPHTLRKEE